MSRHLSIALCAGLIACTAEPAPPPPTCDAFSAGRTPPTSLADLQQLLDDVRARFHPEFADLSITLHPLTREGDYFQSNLDLDTLQDDPRDRHYWLLDNAKLFDDPPPANAVVAILVHELGHTEDFLAKTSDELTAFALFYAAGDVRDYERATDEKALKAGCANGLKAYRVWLYAHVPASVLPEKQRDYFSPDEIDAWVAAHPAP
jgi:hypothetical protein